MSANNGLRSAGTTRNEQRGRTHERQNDFTPAALHARVSSDRQDVDLSVSARLRGVELQTVPSTTVLVNCLLFRFRPPTSS